GYAPKEPIDAALLPLEWLNAWTFGWLSSLPVALPYFPIALPFAIATVVGGIDCTESAAAAGDDYDTRTVIGIEAIATLIAGLSGGVIQTTPYIGHPAYKAMGGRAAYTLATALFIGAAGMLGIFAFLFQIIPEPVVFPVLVFVGLEITGQSFHATPTRHYPAVAIACVPALAFLAMTFAEQVAGPAVSAPYGDMAADPGTEELARNLSLLVIWRNGFIVTSVLWSWALASIIDRKLKVAAFVFFVASACSLFGIIHCPSNTNQVTIPMGPKSWGSVVLDPMFLQTVLEYSIGYLLCGVIMLAWDYFLDHNAVDGDDVGNPNAGPLPRTLEPEVMDDNEETRIYDEMDHAAVNTAFVDEMLSVAKPKSMDPESPASVLDFGTGTALIPIELCQRDDKIRVLAMDASTTMLDVAKININVRGVNEMVQLEHFDVAEYEELPSEYVDCVMSNSLAHHLPDPTTLFAAAKHVLRPGGTIFIRDLARPSNAAEVERLVQQYTGNESETARQLFRQSLHAALTLDEAKSIATSCGFDADSVTMTSDRHWTFSVS
ncbi:MAG: class I SAM-dependent methyltransferase, partial [Planctomycetota bacterium]